MSLANHVTFLEGNISWRLGTVSGAGWISWDFHLPNFQVTYRLSSCGKLFISGMVKQKPPPKKHMAKTNNQILGQVDGATTNIYIWPHGSHGFFSGKWWLHGSIRRKIHPPEKAHRLEPKKLMFFFLFQNLANINRPFNFSGASQ